MQKFPSCLKGTEVSWGGEFHHAPGGLREATSAVPVSFLHAKLLLSHVFLALYGLLTMIVSAHQIARLFGNHVKERIQNISLLNRTV